MSEYVSLEDNITVNNKTLVLLTAECNHCVNTAILINYQLSNTQMHSFFCVVT